MSTVWVLESGVEFEGCDAIGVYSTREKAEQAEASDRVGIEGGATYWTITEFKVDACLRCKGAGSMQQWTRENDLPVQRTVTCPECHGSGSIG